MKLFFDTEFTGLHKETTLISIGIVDENGNSFYAEFTDYDETQVDDWIDKNVIQNLSLVGSNNGFTYTSDNDVRVRGDKGYVRQELSKWLSRYDNIQFVSDVCHYDFVLLIDIFGTAFDIPNNVCPSCHDINQDIARFLNISEKDAFDYTRENFLPKDLDIVQDKHNSLYDAMVIHYIYEICNLDR